METAQSFGLFVLALARPVVCFWTYDVDGTRSHRSMVPVRNRHQPNWAAETPLFCSKKNKASRIQPVPSSVGLSLSSFSHSQQVKGKEHCTQPPHESLEDAFHDALAPTFFRAMVRAATGSLTCSSLISFRTLHIILTMSSTPALMKVYIPILRALEGPVCANRCLVSMRTSLTRGCKAMGLDSP